MASITDLKKTKIRLVLTIISITFFTIFLVYFLVRSLSNEEALHKSEVNSMNKKLKTLNERIGTLKLEYKRLNKVRDSLKYQVDYFWPMRSLIYNAKLRDQVGDALDNGLFKMNSLTHILCLYFTIYYFKDKRHFFDNAMDWLMPGGFLIVHLVDRETFDPILPPGNPLYIVSPQKYAKERITKTKVTFDDFVYNANFNLDENNNIATFEEKFKFNDGHTRKQEQKLYMEDTATIVNMAQDCGFILQGKIDMVKCAYENQYLYLFTNFAHTYIYKSNYI